MSAEATVTATEGAYLRDELDCYFNTYPSVAEGLMVKAWKTGPRTGQPKLRPAAQSLLDRGLVRATPRAGRTG